MSIRVYLTTMFVKVTCEIIELRAKVFQHQGFGQSSLVRSSRGFRLLESSNLVGLLLYGSRSPRSQFYLDLMVAHSAHASA